MRPLDDPVFATLPAHAQTRLDIYAALLLKWNRRMNLSGVRNLEELEDLFLDSLALANFMKSLFPAPTPDFSVWDLGAGAGLPGIPLRLVWTDGEYWLVESRRKRALFLENVLASLDLSKTRVFNGRAEKFFTFINRKADCILSRAFMPREKLIQFCAPHLSASGVLILMSGADEPILPPDWQILSQSSYPTARGRRWLLALARDRHECGH